MDYTCATNKCNIVTFSISLFFLAIHFFLAHHLMCKRNNFFSERNFFLMYSKKIFRKTLENYRDFPDRDEFLVWYIRTLMLECGSFAASLIYFSICFISFYNFLLFLFKKVLKKLLMFFGWSIELLFSWALLSFYYNLFLICFTFICESVK